MGVWDQQGCLKELGRTRKQRGAKEQDRWRKEGAGRGKGESQPWPGSQTGLETARPRRRLGDGLRDPRPSAVGESTQPPVTGPGCEPSTAIGKCGAPGKSHDLSRS